MIPGHAEMNRIVQLEKAKTATPSSKALQWPFLWVFLLASFWFLLPKGDVPWVFGHDEACEKAVWCWVVEVRLQQLKPGLVATVGELSSLVVSASLEKKHSSRPDIFSQRQAAVDTIISTLILAFHFRDRKLSFPPQELWSAPLLPVKGISPQLPSWCPVALKYNTPDEDEGKQILSLGSDAWHDTLMVSEL